MTQAIGLCFLTLLVSAAGALAGQPGPQPPRTWPQAYAVERNDASGLLTLRTPYYVVEQDLKQGGAIARIALTHGKAANLLVQPLETRVRDDSGAVLSDLKDPTPTVTHRREGLNEIVTVECALRDPDGRASALRGQVHAPIPLGIRQDPQGIAGSGRRSRPGSLPAVHDACPQPLELRLSGWADRGRRSPAVLVRQQRVGKAASGPAIRQGAADAPRAAFHDLCRSGSRGPGVVRGLRSRAMGPATHRPPRPGPMPPADQPGSARLGPLGLAAVERGRGGARCRLPASSTSTWPSRSSTAAPPAVAAHLVQPQSRRLGVDGRDPALGGEGHPDGPLPQRRRLLQRRPVLARRFLPALPGHGPLRQGPDGLPPGRDSDRDLFLEQGIASEHQGVPGTRRAAGAGRTARATSSTTSTGPTASLAPRCASDPVGSNS